MADEDRAFRFIEDVLDDFDPEVLLGSSLIVLWCLNLGGWRRREGEHIK
jgi:hypothetical protein